MEFITVNEFISIKELIGKGIDRNWYRNWWEAELIDIKEFIDINEIMGIKKFIGIKEFITIKDFISIKEFISKGINRKRNL